MLESRTDPGVPELTARMARAAFPKGTFAIRVRETLGPLFADEAFAAAFAKGGRPAASPGALALVSVLQHAEGLSDRQAAEQVRGRMDWKFLLGLELDDPGFDFSILTDFRQRLIKHGLEEKVLDLVLDRLREAGLVRDGGRQRTDATHILAAVRTVNRMESVGETLRAALEALAAAAPDWLSGRITGDWITRYGSRVDSYRLPKQRQERQRWVEQTGRDGFTVLEAVWAPDAPDWLARIPAVETLRTVWAQQYHQDDKGVRWREGKDLPPARDRIESPYDPEARYGVKRDSGWYGYKTHLSETCQPNLPHLITHVATTDATVSDATMTETVHEGLARRGLLPDEHVVDAAYVSADNIIAARDRYGVDLVGPVGMDTHHQGEAGAAFAQSAFRIDWRARKAFCPQGKASAAWSTPKVDHGPALTHVRFAATDCAGCPVRDQCTTAKNNKWGRSMTLRPQEHQKVLEERRRQQGTDEWKRRYDVRAGVEGTISQAVRRTGIRRTRYIGTDKTHLGNVFAATAINIIRADAWLNGTPLGRTRTSHLAQLSPPT